MTKYLAAAEEVARWIDSRAVSQESGVWWPNKPDSKPGDISWYAGPTGIVFFLLELYRTTGVESYLARCEEGARWLISKIPTDEALGLFTGCAGTGWVLHQIAKETGGEEARAGAVRAVERLIEKANDDGGTANWGEVTEYLWGTAGIALFLLEYARDIGDTSVRDLAVRAGRWLVAEAKEEPDGGKSWRLGEGVREQMREGADIIYPNFAHGTAGIAYVLATIGAELDDRELIDDAVAGARWILDVARTDDGGCHACHYTNGGADKFHFGWCHGPTGLVPLFHRLHLATGDPEWSEWVRRAAQTVRTSGIPEQKFPGFWDNVARCCGSTGVADLFLDLHATIGEQDDLDFAILMTDDLLARATIDGDGMRWSNYEFRIDEPNLPPETGFMQGASGIGTWLLRLHRFIEGNDDSIKLPHSLF